MREPRSLLGLGACFLLALFGGACSEDSQPAHVSSASQPLSLVTWYGSDAMRRAVRAEETRILSDLDFLGQGTAIGQANLASGTRCIAPMSRDFTTCHSGAATFPVAMDGVLIYTANGSSAAAANPATAVTFNVLKKLFSGNGSGTGCTQYKWSNSSSDVGDLSTADAHFANQNIKLYRLDDASGTTDVFKSKLGISGFCTSASIDITIVRDSNVGCGGISGQCTTCANESATDCMAIRVATSEFALGFASRSASTQFSHGASLSALSVSTESANPTGGTYRAPTEANIRRFQPSPTTAYPLARPVFVNLDGNNVCTGQEVSFIDRSLGYEACAFENNLVNAGFVACQAGGPRTDPDGDCLFCAGFSYACP